MVFFVIELNSRAVEIAGIEFDPGGEWMKQVARNLTDPVDGFLRGATNLRLQRSLKTSRTFKANGISGDLARSLRKEYIAARPATKVFQFPMTAGVAPAPSDSR
jgi:hypothetical protein